jgi:hypothetical protein
MNARFISAFALAASLLVGCGAADKATGAMAPSDAVSYAAQAPEAQAPGGYPMATGDSTLSTRLAGTSSDYSEELRVSDISAKAPPPAKGAPPPPPAPKPTSPPKPQPKPAEGKPAEVASDAPSTHAPILIYTADLTMAVFEVSKSLGAIESLAGELGGFLSKREDMRITIRVPAARFDEAVRRIEKTGDMLHRNVSAEDVTEEYRDLDIRLKSMRAVRDRLEQLLQKAAKVEDSLAIERELDRLVGDIERIEGRMKFLRDRAQYSTITVVFQPKSQEQMGKRPFHVPARWLEGLGLGGLLQL